MFKRFTEFLKRTSISLVIRFKFLRNRENIETFFEFLDLLIELIKLFL